MTGKEIRAVRRRLDLTQVLLARLLGVHPITVTRWEAEKYHPTVHQEQLLRIFKDRPAPKKGRMRHLLEKYPGAAVLTM